MILKLEQDLKKKFFSVYNICRNKFDFVPKINMEDIGQEASFEEGKGFLEKDVNCFIQIVDDCINLLEGGWYNTLDDEQIFIKGERKITFLHSLSLRLKDSASRDFAETFFEEYILRLNRLSIFKDEDNDNEFQYATELKNIKHEGALSRLDSRFRISFDLTLSLPQFKSLEDPWHTIDLDFKIGKVDFSTLEKEKTNESK